MSDTSLATAPATSAADNNSGLAAIGSAIVVVVALLVAGFFIWNLGKRVDEVAATNNLIAAEFGDYNTLDSNGGSIPVGSRFSRLAISDAAVAQATAKADSAKATATLAQTSANTAQTKADDASSLVAVVTGELGYDANAPAGQQLVGWHAARADVNTVNDMVVALGNEFGGYDDTAIAGQRLAGWNKAKADIGILTADRNAELAAAQAHAERYGIDTPVSLEAAVYGHADAEGKWHLGAMDQASNAQATALRAAELAHGGTIEVARATAYEMAKNPFGHKTDPDKDPEVVQRFRAPRRR